MPDNQILTEEVKKLIGMPLKTKKSLPVQASDILRYCRATGNENPAYVGNNLVAPPTFYAPALFLAPEAFKPVPQGTNIEDVDELADKMPKKHALHARWKTTFTTPIHPGDVLTRRGKIVSVTEKQTRMGTGLWCEVEYVATNQNGQEVCRDLQEIFFY